jgi:hypothetical protein
MKPVFIAMAGAGLRSQTAMKEKPGKRKMTE